MKSPTLPALACLLALAGGASPVLAQPSGSAALRGAAPLLLAAGGAAPSSRDALFGDDLPEAGSPSVPSAVPAAPAARTAGLKGYLQLELARTTESPVHWSKMRARADLSAQGALGNGIKWKLGARADYDAVHSLYHTYPDEVARDQRANLTLRENYLDIGAGAWDFRLGRQHVVWGEMVGLFFADVVSARDMREFILPEFEALRIPQWALRAEYFRDDFHAELLWIPVASYDEIGKPGAEFYPALPPVPGVTTLYRSEVRPSRSLANSNYGLRLSNLSNGWDYSAFVYRSMDVAPTFYREIVGPATIAYEARHDRITQYGGTLAKDFGSVVLKSEVVYTRGRSFNVLRASDADGVVPQNILDWAIGLDFSLPADTRFNVQVFQRDFHEHDADIVPARHESGYSLLLNRKLGDRVEAQALWISSINRTDWLFRPRVTWTFERNWRLAVGADLFRGPPSGLFGRYDGRDRVYSEVRYSF